MSLFLSGTATFPHFLFQAFQRHIPQGVLCFAVADNLLWLGGEAVVDVDGALGELLPKKCHHHTGSSLCQGLGPGPQEARGCPVKPRVPVQVGGQEVAWMHGKGSHPNVSKVSG